jgi:hypothetical protein
LGFDQRVPNGYLLISYIKEIFMKKMIYGFIMAAVFVSVLAFIGAGFTGCNKGDEEPGNEGGEEPGGGGGEEPGNEELPGLGTEEPEDDGSGDDSPLMTGTWYTVGVDGQWNSVIYGNGTFVAVGSKIAYSENGGEDWTVALANPTYELADVGFGGGLFVAVATAGRINGSSGTNNGGYYITSADGTSWGSLIQPLSSRALYAVTYGDDTFVFTGRNSGTNGAVFTATVDNGSLTGWSSQQVIGEWVDIVYSGSRSVVVGIGEGNGWTATTPWPERGSTILGGNNKKLYGVTYGAGTFVAVGSSNIILNSEDGSDWKAVIPLDDGGEWRGVAHNGAGMFVAVDKDGAIASSADGDSWTLQESSLSDAEWRSVTYGGDRFVAVSYTGKIACYIPADN